MQLTSHHLNSKNKLKVEDNRRETHVWTKHLTDKESNRKYENNLCPIATA